MAPWSEAHDMIKLFLEALKENLSLGLGKEKKYFQWGICRVSDKYRLRQMIDQR